MKRFAPALTFAALASGAFAHGGVTNPAVMARMEAMSAIGAEVKALTRMARGEVDFETSEVAARMQMIAATAAQVPTLFEQPESDPKSEASPAIWVSYPEFTKRAVAMIEAAQAGAGAADEFELEEALGVLGETCKSCHQSFKIKL